MNVQAIHQLLAMVFDGFRTDVQGVRDLFGVFSYGNELEDFALPGRQAPKRPKIRLIRGSDCRRHGSGLLPS
jgi:hypothetical protein